MNYKKLSIIITFLLSLSSYGEIKIYENEKDKTSLLKQSNFKIEAKDPYFGYGVKTGIVFDFMKMQEDTKTQPDKILGKEISIKDGKIALISDISNYPNSHRVGIIENSKITFEKGKDADNTGYATLGNGIEIKFGKMIFKNSQIIDKDKETNIDIVSNPESPEFSGQSHAQKNPKNLTSLSIERDFPTPSGTYDIKMNGDIRLDFILVNPLNQRGPSLFQGEGANPILKFGKNTRSKFRGITASGQFGSDKHGIVLGKFDDVHILFENGSEVEMENLETGFTNIKFDGGKVKIHSPIREYDGKETRLLHFGGGIMTGKAVFDLKGLAMINGEKVPYFEDPQATKETHLIDIEALPESKVDIAAILNANWIDPDNPEAILDISLKPEEERVPFRFKFDNNSKLYLQYVNEADLTMKEGSHLYAYREAQENEKLNSTNKGNAVQMRGTLRLENTNLHFRVNMKEQLSDKLIVQNNTISGSGGTIYVKNNGSSDTNGKEKVVLIEAKKGVDSGVKFKLANNVEIGAYEYVLDNSLAGSGREYYLIGEKAHIVPDVPSNVKNNVPSLIKPANMKNQKGNSENSINLQNNNIEISPVNSKEYTIDLVQGNINLENNSTLWIEDGRGLKLKNTPINIANSSMIINTKDTNSGVKIDAETSTSPVLKIERTQANTNENYRDLFVNGTLKVVGNKTVKEAITLGKNTVTQIYNPKGNTALDLRNTSMKVEKGAKVYLEGKRALNSKNSNISGEGIFNIKGDIVHEGENGVNLILGNGSFVESSSIQFDDSALGSSLKFKEGSELRINNLSNAKMTFDKGSRIFLYNSEQEKEEVRNKDANRDTDKVINNIWLGNNANTVTFTGVVEMNDIDIYTRVNLKENIGDSIVIDGDKGLLKGSGATLHLRNTGSLEVDNVNRRIRFFTGKLADGFIWKVAHPLEVGAYIYDTILTQEKDSNGITRVIFNLKEKKKRKAKLTSTAMGFMENTYADYFQELGTVDEVFKGMNSMDFSKKDSVWARMGGTTLETKEGFSSNAKSVFVGFDRQLGQIEDLHGGIFIGNTGSSKKYEKYDGDGKSQIFHGGLYLSYRSILGEGDFILKYSKGKTEYSVVDTVGDKISNKYDYSSKMAAFRFGKKLYPFSKESIYIEPAIQVSYGEIDNINSVASNGLRTKLKTVRTWMTGGDVKIGYKTNALNTYVKAGISKEFLGDTDFLFNTQGDEKRQVDKGIFTVGAGLEYRVGNHGISFEIARKESHLLKDFYQASIGYQYRF